MSNNDNNNKIEEQVKKKNHYHNRLQKAKKGYRFTGVSIGYEALISNFLSLRMYGKAEPICQTNHGSFCNDDSSTALSYYISITLII